jgi:metal-responsive CopG/Arc/MetJ family transcriptional regulator
MFYNMQMRIARTVCITLPPDLLAKAQKVAARESRTMSELFREALRRYMAEEPKPAQVEKHAEVSESAPVLHSFRMEKAPGKTGGHK